MPVLLTNTLHESGTTRSDVSLFAESGELTVAGEVVAHFLETADFSEVFDHPEVAPYVINVVAEDDESISEEIVPGTVALRVLDETDLGAMFLHYLDILGENASTDEATLDDKTKLAVFENALLKPLNEKYARGAFRKIHKTKGGPELVNRMIGAIMNKGEIKRAGKGKGYRGGDYERTGRYNGPERKATKTKRMRIRKQSSAKIRASMSRTRGARKRAKALAASVGMEESFLFGFGETYGGAMFQVGTKPDAEIEFTEGELDTLLKTFSPCYEGMVKVKGRRGMKLSETAAANEGSNETREALMNLHEGAQLAPIGVASLSEGAGIAARVVGVMGGPRKPATTLDEAKR